MQLIVDLLVTLIIPMTSFPIGVLVMLRVADSINNIRRHFTMEGDPCTEFEILVIS